MYNLLLRIYNAFEEELFLQAKNPFHTSFTNDLNCQTF
jgi:hypothetical protein